MFRGLKSVLAILTAGAALAAAPWLARVQAAPIELAQVQSQPLPPPAGTPPAPQTPPAATPPSTGPQPTTPTTKTEPPKTPTPGTKPAPKTGQTATKANACPDEKVDINTASADTLKKLPQIGGQRSNAIVKARPYAKPEDLVTRKVLKKAVFEKVKSCITASGVAAAPGPTAKRPARKAPTTATPVPVPAPTGATKPPQ